MNPFSRLASASKTEEIFKFHEAQDVRSHVIIDRALFLLYSMHFKMWVDSLLFSLELHVGLDIEEDDHDNSTKLHANLYQFFGFKSLFSCTC